MTDEDDDEDSAMVPNQRCMNTSARLGEGEIIIRAKEDMHSVFIGARCIQLLRLAPTSIHGVKAARWVLPVNANPRDQGNQCVRDDVFEMPRGG